MSGRSVYAHEIMKRRAIGHTNTRADMTKQRSPSELHLHARAFPFRARGQQERNRERRHLQAKLRDNIYRTIVVGSPALLPRERTCGNTLSASLSRTRGTLRAFSLRPRGDETRNEISRLVCERPPRHPSTSSAPADRNYYCIICGIL